MIFFFFFFFFICFYTEFKDAMWHIGFSICYNNNNKIKKIESDIFNFRVFNSQTPWIRSLAFVISSYLSVSVSVTGFLLQGQLLLNVHISNYYHSFIKKYISVTSYKKKKKKVSVCVGLCQRCCHYLTLDAIHLLR